MDVGLGNGCKVELLSNDIPIRQLVNEKVDIADKQGEDNTLYIADLGDIIDKYRKWTQYLPNVKPFFAVKSNDEYAVLKVLADLGVNFDCASKIEIEKVLSLGVYPDRIIYAHTCKHASMLQYAADNKVSMTTFDNVDELFKIKRIHPTAQCIIRIRPSDKFKVKLQLGKKFGCHSQEVFDLLNTASSLGLNVVGVSFHVGFICQDAKAYADAIMRSREVFRTAKSLGFTLKLLDIGGGYPGKNLKDGLQFENFATTIKQALSEYFHDIEDIAVIAEPGVYFVASAFTLATKIIARQIEMPAQHGNFHQTNGTNETRTNGEVHHVANGTDNGSLSRDNIRHQYYLNDGIYGQLKIVTDYEGHGIYPYQLKDDDTSVEYESCLWGPTCDNLDVVFESVQLQEHDVGEWLYFPNMGAYTLTLASSFNGMPAPTIIYTCNDSTWYETFPHTEELHD